MEYAFLFYLENTKSRVEVVAKSLAVAAKRCRKLYCTQSIALSGVTPVGI